MLYLKDVYLMNLLIYKQNMNGNVKKNIYEKQHETGTW